MFKVALKEVEELLNDANELLEIQGQNGNWNADDYMNGLYNGMESIISIFEGREPLYRTIKEE